MHKKAKITYPRMKGIPAVLTAQGFHKGRLDCIEVSVIHYLDGIAINASSREVFHRRRLALPSSSTSASLSSSTSPTLNSSILPSSLNSSSSTQLNSSTNEEKQDKQAEKSKTDKKTEKVEILLRDVFGTFKGEVPYYSARVLNIPEMSVPGLKELDERYEEWLEEGENK